jgi:hypothetical protein
MDSVRAGVEFKRSENDSVFQIKIPTILLFFGDVAIVV